MYSPSQTKTYSRCRFKWFLSKFLGVDYATIGKRDLAAGVGTAVGAAIQAHYLHKGSLSVEELVKQAESRYAFEVAQRTATGRTVQDCEEAEKYPGMIPGMIHAFLKTNPIPKEWTVDACEAPVNDDYAAYLDLAGTCPRGVWIADVKCKMMEKAGYVSNSLLKFQFDPQLLQYCREWSKKKGQNVQFYRIIYVVGSPVPLCRYQDFEVDWDYMALREQADEVIWWDMKAAEIGLKNLKELYGSYSAIPLEKVQLYAPMAPEHMDGIFKCDMWDPCLLYSGDVSSSSDYISIERKK